MSTSSSTPPRPDHFPSWLPAPLCWAALAHHCCSCGPESTALPSAWRDRARGSEAVPAPGGAAPVPSSPASVLWLRSPSCPRPRPTAVPSTGQVPGEGTIRDGMVVGWIPNGPGCSPPELLKVPRQSRQLQTAGCPLRGQPCPFGGVATGCCPNWCYGQHAAGTSMETGI